MLRAYQDVYVYFNVEAHFTDERYCILEYSGTPWRVLLEFFPELNVLMVAEKSFCRGVLPNGEIFKNMVYHHDRKFSIENDFIEIFLGGLNGFLENACEEVLQTCLI